MTSREWMKKPVKDFKNWKARVICFVLRRKIKVPGNTALEKVQNALSASCGIKEIPFHIMMEDI